MLSSLIKKIYSLLFYAKFLLLDFHRLLYCLCFHYTCIYVLYFSLNVRKNIPWKWVVSILFSIYVCMYYTSKVVLYLSVKENILWKWVVSILFSIYVCMYYTYRIVLYLSVKENILWKLVVSFLFSIYMCDLQFFFFTNSLFGLRGKE